MIRRGGHGGHKVETWRDFDIYVSNDGTFYVLGEHMEKAQEAPSLDGLKKKLIKPLKVNVKAVYFSSHWRHNDEWEKPNIVTINAVSPAGALLYTHEDGHSGKASRFDKMYCFDAEKIKRKEALQREIRKAEKELSAIMDDWPEVTRESLEADAKNARPQPAEET